MKESIKITLPEDISDITLEQSQKYLSIVRREDITAGEYIDLSTYGTYPENLHKVMAVLFRPIVLDDAYDNYEIETYNANSEYAEIMKDAPMNIVNGMLVFFCLLSSELQIHILKSMEVVQAEARLLQVITSRNGAGIQR